MRTSFFLLIFAVLLFISCNNSIGYSKIQLPLEKSQIRSIKLADSLGNVVITLPLRYDTLFSWTDYSDCGKGCAKIKYRSQPKTVSIRMETGFFRKPECTDSIERFTISHSGYFPFHDSTDNADIARNLAWRKNYTEHEEVRKCKIKLANIEKIGDSYFGILIVDLYDSLNKAYCKKLIASTTIKSNIIFFDFELLTNKNDSLTINFIDNSKYYLRTVSIDKAM